MWNVQGPIAFDMLTLTDLIPTNADANLLLIKTKYFAERRSIKNTHHLQKRYPTIPKKGYSRNAKENLLCPRNRPILPYHDSPRVMTYYGIALLDSITSPIIPPSHDS